MLLLLASTLVACIQAHSLCHSHTGYPTYLAHGEVTQHSLRWGQYRTYCIQATGPLGSKHTNLYIKLATCTGHVSIRLFSPLGVELPVAGRNCQSQALNNAFKYTPQYQKSGNKVFSVPDGHKIWTYHNASAEVGTYTIVITGLQEPCGLGSDFQILASSRENRQPPILPENTCINHEHRYTTHDQIGLSWSPAKLTSESQNQTIKYCVYLNPAHSHTHRCTSHGSRCSVAKLRSKETIELCFSPSVVKRNRVLYIARGLSPDTLYHIDIIAWSFVKHRQLYKLPIAYSQSQYVKTLSNPIET